jgi:hypothetical protein
MIIRFFKYSTIIFVAITVILFISLIIATFILSIELSTVKTQFDRTGLINLLEYYSPAINIGAFFTGSLAILLTILRMRQTAENNQLNNCFKHREEFYKEFQTNKFFVELNEITERDINEALRNLYNNFYYSSPNNFYPKMNSKSRKNIFHFYETMKKTKLNMPDCDIDAIPKEELVHISEINYSEVRYLATSMNSKIIPNMKQYSKEMGDDIKEKISKFVYINEFYWSSILYNYLILFDGETISDLQEFFRNYIGIKIRCYYDEAKLRVREKRSATL